MNVTPNGVRVSNNQSKLIIDYISFSMQNFILLFLSLAIFSCIPKQQINKLSLSDQNEIIFLDSIASSAAIIVDKSEGFFDKIMPLEMSIQMKKEKVSNDRMEVLQEYKDFLQADVEDFTKEETDFVNDIMKEAFQLCSSIKLDVFPKKMRLIKTKGKHYGNSVYYTREDMIIIPKNELQARNKNGFLRVMLHEISHIYSRYNPEKRHELYSLIGFKPIEARPILPTSLQNRLLFNPDGINFNYTMDLENKDGEMIKVMPIIVSSQDTFSKKNSAFFDYVKFDLFQLDYNQNNSFSVLTDERGFSTLNLAELPDFFNQIKDNTQYIIHPDEILADNFMYVMLAQKQDGKFNGYSDEGTVLLEEIRGVLGR
ncbi:MAG: hypothetical protein ACI85O_002873 [Saprospiraceae bacterium]|jgi:hypothetical protein